MTCSDVFWRYYKPSNNERNEFYPTDGKTGNEGYLLASAIAI